jgi:queuosine precursor transporter
MSGSRYLLVITGLFVMALVVSNIIAVKLVGVWDRVFDAGTLLFPLTYLIGDVLTEVYGYRQARIVIWIGFLANLIAVGAIQIAIHLPPADFWEENQAAYETVLGTTWRLFLGSLAAYLVGEFTNSFILAKLKVATEGRWLWTRTISSTIVGQGLDSAIFSLIAFAGTGVPLANQIITIWVIKVAWETAATPLTYVTVDFLKRREHLDVYDVDTNFNPLVFERPGSRTAG